MLASKDGNQARGVNGTRQEYRQIVSPLIDFVVQPSSCSDLLMFTRSLYRVLFFARLFDESREFRVTDRCDGDTVTSNVVRDESLGGDIFVVQRGRMILIDVLVVEQCRAT